MKRNLLLLTGFFLTTLSQAQLTVNNTTLTPAQLVQNVLVGGGVSVSNVTFNGAPGNTITNMVGSFNGSASNVGLAAGVILATGDAMVAPGPNNQGGATLGGAFVVGNDPDLNAITTNVVYDQAILEFDFVPVGDSISFRYVFSSEEYNEYVCSGFNDVFGFFISGPGFAGPFTNGAENIALVPGTTTPVAINTVNLGVAGTNGTAANCTAIDPNWTTYNIYYNNNTLQTVQYDGMTVVLTARAAVQCGQTYHIKLAIGDAGDNSFDSGVFLEAGSLTSVGIDVTVATVTGDSTIIEGCSDATFIFSRPISDTANVLTIQFDINGNAINGSDFNFIADSITFNLGEDSVSLVVSPIADGLIEGTDTLVITVYTITPCGDTVVRTATLYIVDPDSLFSNAGIDINLACPGNTANLIGSASGGHTPYSYQWSTGAVTPNTTASPGITTQYILTVFDVCNQTDTDTVTVNVPLINPFILSGQNSSVVCSGDPANISVQFSGGGFPPYTFMWANGDTDTTTVVNPIVTTTYNFTVSDNCGLDSTIAITVTVPIYDSLEITIADAQLCLGEELVVLPVTTGGAGVNTYAWTGPAGSFTINQTNGSTVFVDPTNGTYIVAVTDQCGTFAIDTADYVFVGCELTIPNVISPNNDGKNDVWEIINIEYHPNTFVQIYNRWGVLVYENANYMNTWAGDVEDGTYFYIVVLEDPKYGPYNGTVTVMKH